MIKQNLPKISFSIPKKDTIFTLTINGMKLNVVVLIGFIDFEKISINTSQIFLNRAIVKVIEDHDYENFTLKYKSLLDFNDFKINLKEKMDLESYQINHFLCLKMESLFWVRRVFIQFVN